MKVLKYILRVLVPAFIFFITLLILDRFVYENRMNLFSVTPPDKDLAPVKTKNNFDSVDNFSLNELKPYIQAESSRPNLKGRYPAHPKTDTVIQKSPLQITRSRIFSDAGELLYNATYTTDTYERRVGPPLLKSDIAIITIGCSFTFGTGVNDEQTYSYVLQSESKVPVWNMSMSASYPGDILYDIQYRLPAKYDIPAKKIFIVYGFIPDHFFRNTCDWRCLQPGKNWLLSRERYSSLFGKLYLNNLKKSFYNNKYIADFLLKFKLVSQPDTPIAFPPVLSESSLILFNETLEAIYSELSKKYEIIDSYTVYLTDMGENESSLLLESLKKTDHFKTIIPPYSELSQKYGFDIKSYFIPLDTHPTPLHHYVTGKSIYERLKKDHASYFK